MTALQLAAQAVRLREKVAEYRAATGEPRVARTFLIELSDWLQAVEDNREECQKLADEEERLLRDLADFGLIAAVTGCMPAA